MKCFLQEVYDEVFGKDEVPMVKENDFIEFLIEKKSQTNGALWDTVLRPLDQLDK